MNKEVVKFIDLEKAFLHKNPNGIIKKIQGGCDVNFDKKYPNNFYTYRGNFGEIAKKLNIAIQETTIIIKDRINVLNGTKGEYDFKEDFILYKITKFNYIINGGKILLSYNGRCYNDVKLYENKKGIYFTLNNKKWYL